MQLRQEIPDTFWSLFRSINRETYIDALLCISEEYQYNNYFLTKETCIQVLSDRNVRKQFELKWEETETDFDMLETPAEDRLVKADRGLSHPGDQHCDPGLLGGFYQRL